MGRELQKKKNRSSIQKVRQKPKSKKRLLQHPIIAANWDKTQTLEQNYKRLGLTAKLNKHTGGVEKKAEDVVRMREQMEDDAEGRPRKDDALAVTTLQQRTERLDVKEAKIERDPKTGRILRVIEPEGSSQRPNPLNDPLNELDSDDEDDAMFDQHGHVTSKDGDGDEDAPKTEVVRKLEEEASRPVAKRKQHQSDGERAFVVELIKKYGDDYSKMARDTEINYMQRSVGDLKRRVKKWRESGGTIG